MNCKQMTESNIQAWDKLYGETSGLVWGREPIGFLKNWHKRLSQLPLEGLPILEAGVGEGRNLGALKSLSKNLYACDASQHAIDKIPKELAEGVTIRQCQLSATPFPDAYFQLIALFDVYETLPNLEDVLRELARICRPGGFLLVNIPDLSDGIAGIDMEPLEEGGYLFADKFFYQFHDSDLALKTMCSHGWEELENRLSTWTEEAHPNFRSEAHEHTSRVFLMRRSESPASPGSP